MSSGTRAGATPEIEVAVQYPAGRSGAPAPQSVRRWAEAALEMRGHGGALGVRIVDAREARALNRRWRGVDRATNVLAFPAPGLAGVAPQWLGDVVICAPVVAREARAQGKAARAHWAHMVVHGTLHLLGYDHDEPEAASSMERLESELLGGMGFPDPYEPAHQ